MDRQHLIDALLNYSTGFPEEAAFIPKFLDLLAHPRAYYRDHLAGHITASAWIIDNNADNVLLLHHKKLDRWLQPGGHADGDEDVFRVARKEVTEETGLQRFTVHPGIFDIDIHAIPGRPDFPQHYHYDIRILLQVNRNSLVLANNESFAVKWFSMNDIKNVTAGSDSILRMAIKSNHLFTGNKH